MSCFGFRSAVMVVAFAMLAGFVNVSLCLAAPKQQDPRTAVLANPVPAFLPNSTILFQGDSITDGGRWHSTDPNHIFGQSYPYLIAAYCGSRYPDQNWTFVNRGVSGNKVTDLAARWQTDTLDIKPDVLSILVGINDATSVVNNNQPVTVDQYEATYDQLIAQALAQNPKLKLILLQPFCENTGHIAQNPQVYAADIALRQLAVERLATKYHAPVVPLQSVFDDACKRAPITYWIWDGIHPTAAGHQLIADSWLRTYAAFYGAK